MSYSSINTEKAVVSSRKKKAAKEPEIEAYTEHTPFSYDGDMDSY